MAAIFIIAKRWKQCKCLSIDKEINEMCYIHTVEYDHTAIEGNNFLIYMSLWTNLKNIMLNERSQPQRPHIALGPFL